MDSCSVRRRSGFPWLCGAAGAFPVNLGCTTVSSRCWPFKTPQRSRQAAPDHRNNAHLVLHPIWNVDLSS